MFKKGYFLYVIAVLFTVLTGMFYCISNRFFQIEIKEGGYRRFLSILRDLFLFYLFSKKASGIQQQKPLYKCQYPFSQYINRTGGTFLCHVKFELLSVSAAELLFFFYSDYYTLHSKLKKIRKS
jgi:hypothetical protein